MTDRTPGSSSARSSAQSPTRTLVQQAALAAGAVFLLVGILGFIPGVTSNYSELTFAGHESDAELLGVFEVSILHNIVHLLFGALGIFAARAVNTAALYLVASGVIYLLLTLYGALIDHDSAANFVPVNSADNVLHLLLGLGLLAAGLILGRRPAGGAIR
jgi:hypothetical protein